METNPMTPRQRNRRTERSDMPASPQPMQPQYVQQQIQQAQPHFPQQHIRQMPPQFPQQHVQQTQPQFPQQHVRQMPPQFPQQHVRQMPPQFPQQHVQQTQPQPAARPVSRSSNPAAQQPHAANAVPRALQRQQRPAQSGWQMPDMPRQNAVQRTHSDVPPALRRTRQNEPVMMDERTPEKTPANKLPSWLVASLAVMLIASMALFATLNLMQAYLTTKANERQAAYEAVLSNYHVVENAAGGRSITWQSVIERYASEYNLQPAFVAAIIRNESSFRTNAESNVGARGLMQLMPDTAEWIAGKLDDSSYSFDRMYDAETNIRYGCWYLGYLSELFRGDPILVSAAYHAGQGDVRGWLGDRSISADGLTVPLDKVPIAETRQYAGRVTQAYGIYQTLLYPENAFSAPSAALPADGADHRIAAAVR